MRITAIISMSVVSVIAVLFVGCGSNNEQGIDLRNEGRMAMRIPYGTVSSATFLITETKDGYYKFEKKSYTGDLVIRELGKKPFLIKKGVCLKLERPSSEQRPFVNAMAAVCVARNLNLFVDEPGAQDVTKETDDVTWIVKREQSR
ncbi:MAG TPA: hypothetical protein PKK48_03910 [Phycisphaerae bacterium]|nr:hypothetical protein [Phycisphaerae bacterium]HPS52626.1 hypothetical protein [Phycisphaerae bacterium]